MEGDATDHTAGQWLHKFLFFQAFDTPKFNFLLVIQYEEIIGEIFHFLCLLFSANIANLKLQHLDVLRGRLLGSHIAEGCR